jgi:hypothetical protein
MFGYSSPQLMFIASFCFIINLSFFHKSSSFRIIIHHLNSQRLTGTVRIEMLLFRSPFLEMITILRKAINVIKIFSRNG